MALQVKTGSVRYTTIADHIFTNLYIHENIGKTKINLYDNYKLPI